MRSAVCGSVQLCDVKQFTLMKTLKSSFSASRHVAILHATGADVYDIALGRQEVKMRSRCGLCCDQESLEVLRAGAAQGRCGCKGFVQLACSCTCASRSECASRGTQARRRACRGVVAYAALSSVRVTPRVARIFIVLARLSRGMAQLRCGQKNSTSRGACNSSY